MLRSDYLPKYEVFLGLTFVLYRVPRTSFAMCFTESRDDKRTAHLAKSTYTWFT